MASKFYAALKAKGYDAVYDAHDQKGDYNTKSPVIIFNTGKLLSKKVEELSPSLLEKEYSRAKAIQNKEFEMFRVKEYIKKSEGIQLGLWGYLVAALYMRWRTLEIARIKRIKMKKNRKT